MVHQGQYIWPSVDLNVKISLSGGGKTKKQNLCKKKIQPCRKKKGEEEEEEEEEGRRKKRVRHPFYQADITPYIKAQSYTILYGEGVKKGKPFFPFGSAEPLVGVFTQQDATLGGCCKLCYRPKK